MPPNSLKDRWHRGLTPEASRALSITTALELRKGIIANDPHRPIYHFTGPESWINDPNGPICYKGEYHLYYQYAPMVDDNRSPICWGHAVSDDLIHWVDWPIALWPDRQYDRNGVYSGNTMIDDKGMLNAFYTGNVGGHAECYGMRAWSKDRRLDIQPIAEIEKLRGLKRSFNNVTVGEGVAVALKDVSGSAVEIVAKFSPSKAKRVGINVRASADGSVGLPVWFNSATSEFGVGDKRGKCHIKPGDDVTLRIFVDRSIIEVYAGGRVMTKCALHDPAAQLIVPFAEGGEALLKEINIWQMKSMWDKP